MHSLRPASRRLVQCGQGKFVRISGCVTFVTQRSGLTRCFLYRSNPCNACKNHRNIQAVDDIYYPIRTDVLC